MKSFIKFSENILSVCFNSSFILKRSRYFKAPTCFSGFFSKAFCKGEYASLFCSITCLWLEDNVSSLVIHSYLSIFPDDNADIFAASVLISHYSFWSLILSSIVIITFYIISKRFFLKRKGLSDVRVASITKKNLVFQYIFYKDS